MTLRAVGVREVAWYASGTFDGFGYPLHEDVSCTRMLHEEVGCTRMLHQDVARGRQLHEDVHFLVQQTLIEN
jgi:hypothetical protein